MRRASRPPSLNTVYEWGGEVDAVPCTEKAMQAKAAPSELAMRGHVLLRVGPQWLPHRWLGRRAWAPRYAVLHPASGSCAPPRLLLFHDSTMKQLHEEVLLLAPLQLHCLESDGSPSHQLRFSISSGNDSPVELAASSEDERQQWIFALGESAYYCPSPTSVLSPPLVGGWDTGKIELLKSKVSDNYRMGKVLAQGIDFLVVEGVHLQTKQSRALKLICKSSARFRLGDEPLRTRVCSNTLSSCLEEVYEGPNHVCVVMRWGMHELDGQHTLAAAVLEATRLLRELVPSDELPAEGLMLRKCDAQRLISRATALDCHLQSNLFI